MKTIPPISCKTLSINTLIVVLCLVIYSIGVSATVRYVKPIASGLADGSSWANASDDIQAMINASAITDSVWVAAGEYKPIYYPANCIGCNNSRHYTFFVKPGVRLFGNFTGTETDISQRDFSGSTTFLSGDLNDDDVVSGSFTDLNITGNDENVYHVLLVCEFDLTEFPITIDGFTIKGGNANNTLTYIVNGLTITLREGGGIYIRNQFAIISNCFIVNNSAIYGGGISSSTQNAIINNNIIASNIAFDFGGGFINQSSTCKISNNSFIGNLSLNGGGAICSIASETEINNNEINGNTAETEGGGIYFDGGTNIVFNNTISNNYATNSGGAFYCSSNSNTIRENIIANNIAGIKGGGICSMYSIDSIYNNVIYNNSADMFGGGIYINLGTNTIINNTIAGNTTNGEGGGFCQNDGVNIIANNILWDNRKDAVSNVLSADLFLTAGVNIFQNNLLQLNSLSYTGANFSLGPIAQGNLFAQNPNFVNITNPKGEDQVYFTDDDGLRLRENSPALNTGSILDATPTDILGTTRDTQPDIGAYEHGVFVGIHPNTNSQPSATLNAYPNPATDAITFTFTTPTTHESTLILYSIDGKSRTSLYKATTQAGQTNTLTIDTKAFTPGTYCAVLRCGNRLAQHRTIIIK